MEQQFNDESAVRYLLGQLSAQELEQFEERYFTDDAYLENFLSIKDELIDLYVRGELSDDRLKQFETYFLSSPERRQRVESTKEFMAAISQQSAALHLDTPARAKQVAAGWWQSTATLLRFKSLNLQFSLAALVIIALGLGFWWWIGSSRRDRLAAESQQQQSPVVQPSGPSNAQVAATPGQVPEQELPTPQPSKEKSAQRLSPGNRPLGQQRQRSESRIASVILTPVLTRNPDDSTALVITPETTTARLILNFKNRDYQSYVAVIQTVEGEEVRRFGSIKPGRSKSGSRISLDLPTSLLTRDDYLVSLSGVTANGSVETIGEYYVKIKRQPALLPSSGTVP